MTDGVLYLDVDDEITSAAARIRRAEGNRVVLVLPYGSRVATSRINFRLLARDALMHEKRLSIVAPDGATRALAASAGLPVFASVAEYEGSLEDGFVLTTAIEPGRDGRPRRLRLPRPADWQEPQAPAQPRTTRRSPMRLPSPRLPSPSTNLSPNPMSPIRRS